MRQTLDLLSIFLPAAIVVLGFVRLFVQRPRFTNGFTMFFAILLLLIGLVRYFILPAGGRSSDHGPRPDPLPVSRHSEAFNLSVDMLLRHYYSVTEGFVNGDSLEVRRGGDSMQVALDSLHLEELQKDTVIYLTAMEPLENIKSELSSILTDPSWSEKRGSLNILSDNLRGFLTVIRYDRAKLYWQECPEAFGEDKPGYWLSPGKEAKNPYHGSKDPEYGDKMLICGSPKDTLNFLVVDSLRQ